MVAEEGMIVARPRELKNLSVVRKVLDKEITQLKASEVLSLSSRQIRRIVKRVRLQGDQGVIHKSRGRASNRRVPRRHRRSRERKYHFEEMEHLQWFLQAIKKPQAVSWTQEMKLRSRDTVPTDLILPLYPRSEIPPL